MIMVLLNVSIDQEANFFENVYQHDWYMGLAIAFSCVNLLGFTPIFYLIIWYEHFGSDHPRTLLNLLVNSHLFIDGRGIKTSDKPSGFAVQKEN